MPHALTVKSFAKINLYLDVLDHRADGFNNIETIFQTISLCDELTMSPAEGLSLTCDHPALAAEPNNLVLRAAHALIALDGQPRGAALALKKHIPVAAGLAGGSGDAAAALAGLNRLWELHLDDAQLAELALALGSDVPYCLRGGTASAMGRGEIMETLPALPKTWLVLVHPPIGVSAAWVYRHPQLERSPERAVNGKTPPFARAIAALGADDLSGVIFNRMESVVFAEHPQLAAWKDRLLGLGCTAAVMSGSGPTLLGFCRDEADARAVAQAFSEAPVSVAHTVPHGLELCA